MAFHSLRSWFIAALAAPLLVSVCNADVAVSAGGSRSYTGTAEISSGNTCALSIEIEKTQFVLLVMGGKYRLVRMRVNCSGMRDLALSSSDDRLRLTIAGDEVVGILSLQRSDSVLWDSLADEMRRTLAYPPFVKTGQPVYLFAYFPADAVTDWPERFSYTIASLARTVSLEFRPTAARN